MNSVLDEVFEEVEPAPDLVSVAAGTTPATLLSIDVGTSGVRAALFDEDGSEIPDARVVNRRRDSGSDFAELDPEQLVAEVVKTIDELLTYHVHQVAQIDFIAISTFWHSLIGVDRAGNPTTSLLTWADTRAAESARELRSEFNESEIHLRTGCRFHPSYWPAKLRWLKREQREMFSKTQRWLGFAEYLCQRLCGEPSTSISMASATGLFNQQECDWDWAFVDALGFSPDTLPAIQTQENRLTREFADRWPALAEARLVTIVGDGAANNVGAGCTTKDRIALMVGTSGAMRVVYSGEPPAELAAGLWSYRVSRHRVVVGGALSDGGGLFKWLNESLRLPDLTTLEREIDELEPDGHGLTLLPFWSGERSTGWLAQASGGIFGLQQHTKPAEIARAALEAMAYRFALITRSLDQVAPDATIVASGNALRSSPAWLQIMADVLGRRLILGGSGEASSRGAALLALEAVGKIATIDEDQLAVDEVFEPNASRHARYQQAIARQEELYERVFKEK